MKRISIWTSVPCTDMVEDIMRENPAMREEVALDVAYQECEAAREDMAHLLDSATGNKENTYVLYGSTGTWYGRQSGFSPLEDMTFGDAWLALTAPLERCDSHVYAYIDENGDLIAHKVHHDGENIYTLRRIDRPMDEDDWEIAAHLNRGSSAWFEDNASPLGEVFAEILGIKGIFKEEGDKT